MDPLLPTLTDDTTGTSSGLQGTAATGSGKGTGKATGQATTGVAGQGTSKATGEGLGKATGQGRTSGAGTSGSLTGSQSLKNTPSQNFPKSGTKSGSSGLTNTGPEPTASSGLGFNSIQTSNSGNSAESGSNADSGVQTTWLGSNTGPSQTIQTSARPSQSGSQGNGPTDGGPSATKSEGNVGLSQPANSAEDPSSTGQQGAGTSNVKPPATNPGGRDNTITAPPVIPTKQIASRSPAATSNGTIIGGLLADLSKAAKSLSNDITIPATKTAFIDGIDDTEDQLKTLFTDMGGKLPPDTGGCSGGAQKQRRSLGGLVGDVFNTVRCAINSLDTLKGHVDVPEPDIGTIEGDLDDVGGYSENIDDNPDNDEDDDSSTDEQRSTKEPSTTKASTKDATTSGPSSTVVSFSQASNTGSDMTTSFTSSRASSSDPRLGGASTTEAGGLVKRPTGDFCDYSCPSPIPAAPTSGPLAIEPGPTDPEDAQQKHRRDIAGRVRLQKRANGAVSSINNCQLLTPSNPPDPVTTPDYLE
ncbi:MAG: hypothetical protein Q9203_004910 [Teloschistes exilis]